MTEGLKQYCYYVTKTDGYERVGCGRLNEYATVHQLIAIAEGADPHKVFSDGEWHVHHKNNNQWDNRPCNLEVMTREEHMKHHGGAPRKYTNEELLSWLECFVEEFGFAPKEGDIRGWPGPEAGSYIHRFGSMKAAAEEIGLKPRGHDS